MNPSIIAANDSGGREGGKGEGDPVPVEFLSADPADSYNHLLADLYIRDRGILRRSLKHPLYNPPRRNLCPPPLRLAFLSVGLSAELNEQRIN